MIMEVSKEFRFEASHQLPNHDGKCRRLHGHSFRLVVTCAAEINGHRGEPKEGMVVDYSVIKDTVQPIIDALDHYHLGSGLVEAFDEGKHPSGNEATFIITHLPADEHLRRVNFPLVPTSENILIWIASQLPLDFCWFKLELNETCTSAAVLYREQGQRYGD